MKLPLAAGMAAFTLIEGKNWNSTVSSNASPSHSMEAMTTLDHSSASSARILRSIHSPSFSMGKRKARRRGPKHNSSQATADTYGSFALQEWPQINLQDPLQDVKERKDSAWDEFEQQSVAYIATWTEKLAAIVATWPSKVWGIVAATRDWISAIWWLKGLTRRGHKPWIATLILLLLCFGSMYVLLESLLNATRVAAECSATTSTIFIPYTETITFTAPPSSSAGSIRGTIFGSSTPPAKSYTTVSTVTTTIARTTTVTVEESFSPTTSPATATVTATISVFETVNAAQLSTGGQYQPTGSVQYTFYVTSGSTVWQNGMSPSNGVSLAVFTSSVLVVPIPPSSVPSSTAPASLLGAPTSPQIEPLTTFTPPAYSSTTFSVLDSALTTTLTSTRYITRSLSRVTPSASSRAGFSGVNSAGWNATSSPESISAAATATTSPRFTKFTRMVYFGHNDITTSTSAQLVTATVGDVMVQALSSAPSSSLSTSMTGLSTTSIYVIGPSTPYSSSSREMSSTTTDSSMPNSALLQTSLLATSTALSRSTGALASSNPSSGGIHQTIGTPSPTDTSSTALIASSTLAASYPDVASFSSFPTPKASSGIESTSTFMPSQPAGTPTDHPGPSVSDILGTYSASAFSTSRASSAIGSTISDFVIEGTTPSQGSTGPVFGATTSAVVTSATLSSGSSASSTESSTAPVTSTDTSSLSLIASTLLTTIMSSTTRTYVSSTAAASPMPTTSEVSLSKASSSPPFSSSPTAMTVSVSTMATSSVPSLSSRNATSSATRTSNAPFPGPSCGEQGDFNMNFDDLPTFHSGSARLLKRQASSWNVTNSNGGNGTSDITQQPPLDLRPYKHMLFSGGYVYAPQPVEPFAPASPPNVAVFLANTTGMRAGPAPPSPGDLEPGEIADGPYHEGQPAFFFDARSAALGCDSETAPCTMEVTGYTWNDTVKDDVPTYYKNYTLSACKNYRNCQLTTVEFPDTFRNLSGIRMRAVRGSEPRTFFADDIKARWSDNSCAAGQTRKNSP